MEKINNENGTQLKVIVDFTSECMEQLKSDLLESVLRTGNEALDLSSAGRMDVVGIQYAYAWKKALTEKQRTATITLPAAETVKDLLGKTGITQIL